MNLPRFLVLQSLGVVCYLSEERVLRAGFRFAGDAPQPLPT